MFLTVPPLLPRLGYFNCAKWVTLGCCLRAKGFCAHSVWIFSNFPWRGNQLLVVKRRLINCPLSCRIAWFLKKRTKALFQDSSILFRAYFSNHRISCSAAPSTRLSGTDCLLPLSPFNAVVNRADWFVTSCSFNLIDKRHVKERP